MFRCAALTLGSDPCPNVAFGAEIRVQVRVLCLRSFVPEVPLRQRLPAQCVGEGAPGPGGEELPQTAGPDPVRPQRPPLLLRGTGRVVANWVSRR